MGLLSEAFPSKEEQVKKEFTPNDMYNLGEEDEPSLMQLFARWSGQRIKQGKQKLAEVR